ncbi:MAG: nitroreductase family protein [Clostridia bacterium]|nr:nitroreductase family protein [Clostridia bacterium]
MDILELIKTRHSTRSYTGETVDNERLFKILEAGRLSPSARNTQPWKLYASTNKEILDAINVSFQALGRNLFFKNAGGVIAITEEPLPEGLTMSRRYAEYDIGMCIMQICLEAESLGIGTCILGTFDEGAVKSALGIPAEKSVSMVICLGISAEQSVPEKNRKSFDDTVAIR